MTHADREDNTDTGEWQLRTTDLISWASQVANGMDYLSSKNILHGDLAARNVLLYSLKVIKISDFGLSRKLERGIYIKSSDSPLPYKWLALECFTNHTFSVKTDVWAFGVFLWELFSLGAMPYPGVTDGRQLLTMLQNAYRLENPVHSNKELYDLMLSCWYVAPHRRPDFRELASVFNAMLPMELRDVS
ncbi:fibroblast growth factor receptor-like [Anopheles coustani]|uniref:fibroblast growth factor receptor-like n=1 Tax=Anopheles coustani TaxID=139045 RepID=UPI00265974E2|nr:fibroblast growth factor receptor-like [Anopheles coustani]